MEALGAERVTNIAALIRELKSTKPKKKEWVVVMSASDPHQLFRTFCQSFKRLDAAGGLVYNAKNELLVIKRNGYWDLPKGKRDAGEGIEACALREVEEECGINRLRSMGKLSHTYHFYFMRGQWCLKKTSWYKMKYWGKQRPVPQQEEGITEIRWITKKDVQKLKRNTYPLVYELLLKAW